MRIVVFFGDFITIILFLLDFDCFELFLELN